MSIGSIPCPSTAATCSAFPRICRMPPCTLGCSVFTRPSSISGKLVSPLISRTASPASRSAFAVPPVETSSTLCFASARANSTSPALSVTLSSARRIFRRPPSPAVADLESALSVARTKPPVCVVLEEACASGEEIISVGFTPPFYAAKRTQPEETPSQSHHQCSGAPFMARCQPRHEWDVRHSPSRWPIIPQRRIHSPTYPPPRADQEPPLRQDNQNGEPD